MSAASESGWRLYGLTVKTARGIGYYLDKQPEATTPEAS
jgi:hypothetical protein